MDIVAKLVNQLNEQGIRFLLIGGQAMNLHGHNRETQDFDFWIEATLGNCDAIYNAIVDNIGYNIKSTPKDLLGIKKQIQLRGKIDVITAVEGLSFEDIYERSLSAETNCMTVRYPNVTDMLTLKSISAKAPERTRDSEDIEYLRGKLARDAT